LCVFCAVFRTLAQPTKIDEFARCVVVFVGRLNPSLVFQHQLCCNIIIVSSEGAVIPLLFAETEASDKCMTCEIQQKMQQQCSWNVQPDEEATTKREP
jgi:hypothetical protein